MLVCDNRSDIFYIKAELWSNEVPITILFCVLLDFNANYIILCKQRSKRLNWLKAQTMNNAQEWVTAKNRFISSCNSLFCFF